MTQPTEPRTLGANIPLGKKIGLFLDYLMAGNEVTVNGLTYVWCDHHITRTEMDDSGKELHFGIDGLALKCESYNTGTKETSHRYIGQQDLPLNQLIELIENLTEFDWLGITAFHALRGMQKERILKSETE